ncbi:MAG: hypothetical protein IJA52_06260 [Clostridia bacterium]|nr:hypothetical protein [Clostridia bacterium]
MKKVLSILLVLAVLASTISVVVFAEDAALGTYENPYLLDNTATEAITVNVPAESGVYVKVNNCNGSVANVVEASSQNYFFWYCRQTYNAATELTMVTGADTFQIQNNDTEALTIKLTLTGGGDIQYGTMDNPEVIELQVNPYGGALGAYVEAALEAGNEGHWYSLIAPADGVFMIGAGAYDADYNDVGWLYFVNNLTKGSYGNYNYSDDAEPVYYEEVAVSAGDELQIFVATYNPENMWANPEGTANISVSFAGVGSMGAPENIEAGDHSASLEEGNQGHYYKWTATEEGTATITMNDASGWQYSINGEKADGGYIYGDMHWSDDDPVVSSEEIGVMPGDVLTIFVATYDPANMWANPAGTVNWTLSFVAGENGEGGGDDIGGGDIGGDEGGSGDETPECNFIHNDGYLVLGTNDYPVDPFYPYTLYTFEPENTGKYTFTCANGLIGLVSTNGMWVNVGESGDYISEGVVTENSFEWLCTGVGQSIWVAVLTLDGTANVTVDYEEVVIKEIPREYHENAKKPEAFDFTGNADDLLYVDTFDAAVDTAVLGEDGYYHLNSADGPILYADLNDTLMSLEAANSYGQLKELIYEGDEVVKVYDFTIAMIEYLECMDEETGLYPLTDDLIAVFKKAGTSLGWYGDSVWVGGDLEDCWMFACYYLEGEAGNIIGGGNADNNNGGNTNGSDVNLNGGSSATGDNFVIVMIAAMIALCGMATVIIIRKRRMTSK